MAKQAEPLLTDDVAPDAAEAEKKPKSKKGLFMLLLVVLLALGAGGFVAYSQYTTLAMTANKVGLGGTKDQDQVVEYGEFLEIDGLVVNPADSEGRRFLMVKLGIESTNASVLDEVSAKQVVVRDTVLKLLARRTVAELAAVELRTELKEELRAAVNGVLRDGEVQRLYFTQYVLQ